MPERWILEQNISRFREMLQQETDPEKRRTLERLLDNEQSKLAELDRTEKRP